MKYMLDTNICIYAIKHKPPEVIKNFLKHDPDDMCISSITYGELMHGVEKSQAVEFLFFSLTIMLQKNTERFVQTLNEREHQLVRWIC